MNCKYMRIQRREDSWITKYPKGIVGMCWRMISDGIMSPEDEKADDIGRDHEPGGRKDVQGD